MMGEDKKVIKGKMEVAGIMGPIWMIGWLFTIGYADLNFIRILWGLLLWPYYLGNAV